MNRSIWSPAARARAVIVEPDKSEADALRAGCQERVSSMAMWDMAILAGPGLTLAGLAFALSAALCARVA